MSGFVLSLSLSLTTQHKTYTHVSNPESCNQYPPHFGSFRPWCVFSLSVSLHTGSVHVPTVMTRWDCTVRYSGFLREMFLFLVCVLVSLLSLIFSCSQGGPANKIRCSGGSRTAQANNNNSISISSNDNERPSSPSPPLPLSCPLLPLPHPQPHVLVVIRSLLNPSVIPRSRVGDGWMDSWNLKLELVRSLSVSQREAGFQVAGEEFFVLDGR